MPLNYGQYNPYTGFYTYPAGKYVQQANALWVSGRNYGGVLGINDSSVIFYSSPIQVGSLTDWKQIDTSNYSWSAIKNDGTLWSCGYNAYSQLGNGTDVYYSSPVQIGSLTNWKQVSIGSYTQHAIKTDGTLWGWGNNYYGGVGNGTVITSYSSPVQIGSLTNWAQISDGDSTAAAIKTDGTLWAWGYGGGGILANSLTLSYSSPIQVGSLTNWKQVSMAASHGAAIKTDGTLWAWGGAALGNGTSGIGYSSPVQIGALTNWKQVACGAGAAAAVKTDGTLWTWGDNPFGVLGVGISGIGYASPVQVGTLTNWSAVSLGRNLNTLAAVKTDGTLWVCGYNNNGVLGNNANVSYSSPVQVGALTNWSAVSIDRIMAAIPSPTKSYGNRQDLGERYITESYLLDVYPNIPTSLGRTSPKLFASGENTKGALGVNNTVYYSSPVQVGALTNWKQVSAGGNSVGAINYFSHAIKSDGTLWAWGSNNYYLNNIGQLGLTNTVSYSSPVQVGALTNWKQVSDSVGGNHVLAVKTDGTLWAWGSNRDFQDTNPIGQLGTGDTTTRNSPVQIGALTNWKYAKAAGSVSYAIKTDGTLWAWGQGGNGQMGNNATASYSSPIQVGALSNWKLVASGNGNNVAAIKTDGTLWVWGYNTAGVLGNSTDTIQYSSPIQIGSLNNWKTVSNSGEHMIAVKTDGTLWAWGNNFYGNYGVADYRYSSDVLLSPIQVGSLTTWNTTDVDTQVISYNGQQQNGPFVIDSSGKLWVWGANSNGNLGIGNTVTYMSPVQVGSLTNWKQMTSGTGTWAVKTDGTMWCWGDSGSTGQLGNGTVNVAYSSPVQIGALTNWKQVASGTYSVYAVKTDGTMWNWGYNPYGQLGNGTIVNYSSPIQVGSLTTWKQVAAGSYFGMAVKTDGTLWVTGGYNNDGGMGVGVNGTTIRYSSPIQVGSLTNWKNITCGDSNGWAVKTDGTLWTWGNNSYGQLGNGTTVAYSSPIQIGSLTNWKYVTATNYNVVAIKTDGTLWTWGDGTNYGLGLGSKISYSSPVQIGSLTNWRQIFSASNGQMLATKSDGTLWSWGSGYMGTPIYGTYNVSSPMQIGSLTNWKSALAIGKTSYMLKTDGTLWATGENTTGAFGNGSVGVYYSSPVQVGSLTTWKQISSSGMHTLGIVDGYM